MLSYIKVLCNKTQQEYIYITLEGELTKTSCRQLLVDINSECQRYGYERIMVDLSKLKQPLSVAVVFRAATTPDVLELLPFRLAWVNDDVDWKKNWKNLELVMRNRKLPWKSFSDTVSAEQWLIRDRRRLFRE